MYKHLLIFIDHRQTPSMVCAQQFAAQAKMPKRGVLNHFVARCNEHAKDAFIYTSLEPFPEHDVLRPIQLVDLGDGPHDQP